MTPVVQRHFTEDVLQLLKETFEGPASTGPSAFLVKGTGLFQTVDDIPARIASAETRAGGSTIAAHTEHIRFYVTVHHTLMLGVSEKIDWDESWRIKTVTAVEWDNLRLDLRKAYTIIDERLRGLDRWGEDNCGLTMAIIAHTAYHLGAIRQILLGVSSQNQI